MPLEPLTPTYRTASPTKLSVVCPAYEEEEVLPLFHAELARVLDGLAGYEIEIIYVDDGSRDDTVGVLRRLAAADARISYLSLSRNFGHQAALTAGLEHARGDVIVSLDSDLQHPPALIPTLLDRHREGHDVVVTLREDDPSLSRFKRATSHWFYRVMQRLCDIEVRTAASDFRLLSRRALDGLLQLDETHRFVRGMVSWIGFRTAVVPFRPAKRGAGVSKYSLRKMLALAGNGLFSFSRLPLKLSLTLGLTSLAVAATYAAYIAIASIFGLPNEGWPVRAVLLSLYLLGGAVLCGLGIVGEYVGRVYEQVKGRPLYLLKESRLAETTAVRHENVTRRAA